MGTKVPILQVLFLGLAPSAGLKRPVRILRRLQVLILLDLRSSPTVLSISLLVTLSKPNTSPSKAYRAVHHSSCNCTTSLRPEDVRYAFGGPGGSRTRVLNTFLSASYSNNLHCIFIWSFRQHHNTLYAPSEGYV